MVETVTVATERMEKARPRPFRRFPEYKDSGIEWLGEVPEHWVTWKATHGFRRIGSGTTPKSDDPEYYGGDISWVTTSELRETVIVDTIKRVTTTATREYPTLRIYPKGTLLFAMSGATIGRLGILGTPATVNQACAAFAEPLHLATSFVYYWLQMRKPILTVLSAGGGQPNLSQDDLRQLRIPAPPLDEQRTIAVFLDRETAKIDGLVARKERLIDLLQEKRAALITRAVTRGLDPDVPMKDSGVEWLGEIPAHWEVRPLKSISDLQTGLTLGKRYESEAMTTRPYLRVANVQDGYLALDDIAEVEVPARDVRRFELQAGDVLMTEGGDFDKLGRGHVWKEELAKCLHQNHIFAVRPRRDALTSHFLALVMSSAYGRAYFTATSKQSTNLASTNSTKLRNLPFPLPGLDDQVEITRWTDRETAKIDALIAKVHQAIDHLKEFRTALISAAVTGKIDVRGEAS